jgi:hypothetical protein
MDSIKLELELQTWKTNLIKPLILLHKMPFCKGSTVA